MRGSKLIGEILIIFCAFPLIFTDGQLKFGIVTFWDYFSVVGILVGLFLTFKGGLKEHGEDINYER